MIWPDTGLQWVQTSPNIPDVADDVRVCLHRL